MEFNTNKNEIFFFKLLFSIIANWNNGHFYLEKTNFFRVSQGNRQWKIDIDAGNANNTFE